MKQILALAFAGALSAIVAACGGGGTRVEPVTHYAGVADILESGCPYAVGAVVPGHTSASSAQSAALSRCTAEATRQAAGAARVRSCQATSIRQCVAIAAGIDNARDCQVSTRSASSLSSARSSALQACRSALGSGADCEVLASGCASSSSPSVGSWTPPPPPVTNSPPQAVGSIPGQTVEVGSSETVSVSSYFTDPDRDSLTYASRSSDTGIVAVSVSGNTVTLRGVSEGTATVRVTATDPDGQSAYQDFAVEVEEEVDGIGSGQVGPEFGRTSTTGRTNLNLTCTDDVVFSHSGNVVLPSVDVVALPSEAGTVTLEYDSKSIPDRFVVVLGGQVVIDTQYVGHENTVQGVNAVLTRYGFTPTSQASIISPGRGSRSFSKAAGVRSTVVRVYAPLEGTAWDVTLKFAGSSCPSGGGNGGGTPTNGAPQAAAARTLSGNVGSSWTWTRAELESAFRDPDGDQLTYTIGSSRPTVASSNVPSGGGMEINANSPGTAVISVTARDPGGLTATWRITVTVNQAAQQRLFGAVAVDVGSNCSQHGGMVANRQSESSARTEAINLCVSTGGSRSECASAVTLFGSAYAGAIQCASVAYGETRRNDGTHCGLYPGRGDTASAARQSALSNCRANRSSCQTSIAISGSAFGLCTD